MCQGLSNTRYVSLSYVLQMRTLKLRVKSRATQQKKALFKSKSCWLPNFALSSTLYCFSEGGIDWIKRKVQRCTCYYGLQEAF